MAKQFRNFEDAREFVQKLGLKNFMQWREYAKSGNKPADISSNPNYTYKNKWKGYGDWLGTRNVRNTQFCSFKDSLEFVRSLNLKNWEDWNAYCKSGNKPKNIPSAPHQVYKNKGWKGMGDFLGTGNVPLQNKQFRPYKEAREFVRSLGLKGYDEWFEYCKSGNKPDDIPATPWNTYKEWKKK